YTQFSSENIEPARRPRAGADAEFDAVAVAIVAVRQPPVAHAVSLIHRAPNIAPAYRVAVDLPDAARHDSGARERRRAVGEVNGAHRLTGNLAGSGRATQGYIDEFAVEVIGGHGLAGGRLGRFPAPGQRQQRHPHTS